MGTRLGLEKRDIPRLGQGLGRTRGSPELGLGLGTRDTPILIAVLDIFKAGVGWRRRWEGGVYVC